MFGSQFSLASFILWAPNRKGGEAVDQRQLELVQRAVSDSDAFSELFEQYKPMVLGVLKGYRLQGMTQEDWLQEARIAMLKAARHFNGRAGSQFGPFYKLVLVSHIRSRLRYYFAQKRKADANAVLIGDTPALDVITARPTPKQIEDRMLIRVTMDGFLLTLNEAEVRALLDAISVRDAKKDRVLRRTREKLSNYLQEDGPP